jgi:long-subunit fatty acid transport protein
MRLLARHSAVVLGVLALASAARAQDAQQAAVQYGPSGTLLDGAIIGGVSDLSAGYYNPGALALLESPKFAISLVSGSWDRLKIKDPESAMVFNSKPFTVLPGLVAGSLYQSDKLAISWSFLLRNQLDYDFAAAQVSISQGSDGSGAYSRRRQRIREYWIGPTFSYRVGQDMSIGITTFGTYRLQRFRNATLVGSADSSGVSSGTSLLEREYDQGSLLAKMGLSWRPGHAELGFTVTTPGIGLWSQGRVRSVVTVAGVDNVPFLGGIDVDGLDATYRSPWSVGGGISWRGHSTVWHASSEWYSSVDAEPILDSGPVPIYGSNQTYTVTLLGGRKSVLWAAAGVEHKVSELVSLNASVSWDPSSAVPGADLFSGVDVTSVSAGVHFPMRRTRVGLGLSYGWGDGPVLAGGALGSPPAGATASLKRLSFSFGTVNR